MDLYNRFLIIVAAVVCTAAAICGILTAKRNTERRLYGEQKQLPVTEELLSFILLYCASHHKSAAGI